MKTSCIILSLIATITFASGCKHKGERPDTNGVRSVEIISYKENDTILHITANAEINSFADLFVPKGHNPESDNVKREMPKVDGRIIFLRGKMIAIEANYCFGHGYQFTTGDDTTIHLFTKRLELFIQDAEYRYHMKDRI